MLTFIALTTLVHAHAGAELTGIDADTSDALETSFGVLLQESDGWSWVCHEAVSKPASLLTPKYAFGPDGSWIATVPDLAQTRDGVNTVYRTVDGCDWDPVTGLEGEIISYVAYVDADRIVAVTADLGADSDASIFTSGDGGETWERAVEAPAGSLFLKIETHGEAVWTVSFEPANPSGPLAWRSPDGGATWTSHPIDVSEWATDRPLSVSPLAAADADTAWLGVSVTEGHVLLRTTDGGQSFQTVHTVDGFLSDGAIDSDGGIWMVEGRTGLWYAADGVDFDIIPAPQAIGVATEGTEARISASAIGTGALLHRVRLDGSTEFLVTGEDLTGPLECPEDSDQTQICGPLWELVQLGQGTPDTDDPDPESTDTDSGGESSPPCGCQAAPITGLAWFALLPLLGWRRR